MRDVYQWTLAIFLLRSKIGQNDCASNRRIGNEMGCELWLWERPWWKMVCKEFGNPFRVSTVSFSRHQTSGKGIFFRPWTWKDEERAFFGLSWIIVVRNARSRRCIDDGIRSYFSIWSFYSVFLQFLKPRCFVVQGNQPWNLIERDLKNLWAGGK